MVTKKSAKMTSTVIDNHVSAEGSAVVNGKSIIVNLDDVRFEFNVRDGWGADEVDERYIPGLLELQESILKQGFKASKPIEVYSADDGGYIVTEGNRRLKACKMVEGYQNHSFSPDLPPGHIYAVEIPKPNMADLVINQISSNIAEECTPFDIAKAARILIDDPSLMDENGKPMKSVKARGQVAREERVAKLLGLSGRQAVQLHLMLLELDEGIKKILIASLANEKSSNEKLPQRISISTAMRIMHHYKPENGNIILNMAIKNAIDSRTRQTYDMVRDLAESMFGEKKEEKKSQLTDKTPAATEPKPINIIDKEDDDIFEDEKEEVKVSEVKVTEKFVEFEDEEEDLTTVVVPAATATATEKPPKATQDLAKKREQSEGAIILQLARLIKEMSAEIADNLEIDGGVATLIFDSKKAERLLELSSAVSEFELA
jgi:hypothetical protein